MFIAYSGIVDVMCVSPPRRLPPRPETEQPGTTPKEQPPKESKREKELRERKAYLKNFWYAVGTSNNLKADKPMEVKILGRTVALFRDEDGEPSARCTSL